MVAKRPTFEPSQSWNRYSYTTNNPLRYIDPTGMSGDDPQDYKPEFRPCTVGVDAGCSESSTVLGAVTVSIPPTTPVTTTPTDSGAVSLNLQDLAQPLFAVQYVPTPGTMPNPRGRDMPDRNNFTQITVGGQFPALASVCQFLMTTSVIGMWEADPVWGCLGPFRHL